MNSGISEVNSQNGSVNLIIGKVNMGSDLSKPVILILTFGTSIPEGVQDLEIPVQDL